MAALLLFLLAAALTIFVAAYLQHSHFGWAYLTCSYTLGLCNAPGWVGVAAAVLFAVYIAHRSWV